MVRKLTKRMSPEFKARKRDALKLREKLEGGPTAVPKKCSRVKTYSTEDIQLFLGERPDLLK
jgi:hypothetical protein